MILVALYIRGIGFKDEMCLLFVVFPTCLLSTTCCGLPCPLQRRGKCCNLFVGINTKTSAGRRGHLRTPEAVSLVPVTKGSGSNLAAFDVWWNQALGRGASHARLSLEAEATLPAWAQETAVLGRAPRTPAPRLALAWAGGRAPHQARTVVDCLAENKPAGLCVMGKETGV